jgi:hypothetical protein
MNTAPSSSLCPTIGDTSLQATHESHDTQTGSTAPTDDDLLLHELVQLLPDVVHTLKDNKLDSYMQFNKLLAINTMPMENEHCIQVVL